MNTSQHETRVAYQANRIHPGKTCQDGGPTQPATAAKLHRSKDEMEALVPIKMQHAAATFVINHLKAAKSDWIGLETEVGGEDDRKGIDFHLINRKEGADIPVDFSTSSKGGFAVRLKYEWFKEEADGTFVFIARNASALFHAFLPAMDPNNKWDLLGWKLAQKA
jgi:hypothetical protein